MPAMTWVLITSRVDLLQKALERVEIKMPWRLDNAAPASTFWRSLLI